MMKKNIFFIAFLFCTQILSAQNKPYVLRTEFAQEIDDKLNLIDPQWFDLYRSESVDNEVIVTTNNQQITIVLYAASKMRAMNLAFNEGLVKKGAIMSGEFANSPRTFKWNIDESNKVSDITTY